MAAIRPEIQALRALAVALVVVYHLWPAAVPAGFVGVDVFFVISGFLITRLLLREIDRTGGLRLVRFWARRARRILPAALVTVAACALAVVAVVPISRWPQFLGELRASALYVQNWRLAGDAVDYFAVAANTPSPVQHFWSLAIEEQFYLAWPIVLAVAARWRAVPAAIAALTALSFAFSLHDTAADPAAAYFVTPARAWEFGAGGLLAAVREPARASPALSWGGVAAIVAGALAFRVTTPFPGAAALVPVLGAAAVIRGGAGAPLLGLRPVQWLGDLSYSVYLWHWPLLILIPFAVAGEPTSESRSAILMLTLLFAWLSKRFVEDPVRRSSALAPPLRTFCSAGAATVLLLALIAYASAYVESQFRESERATHALLAARPSCFGAAARDPRRPCRNPRLRLTVVPTPLEARDRPNAPCATLRRVDRVMVCTFGAPARTATATIALVGDSHASHWRAALDVVARRRGWRGVSLTHTSCPLSLAPGGLPEPERSQCYRWRTDLFRWFRRHAAVHTVFVSAVGGLLGGGIEVQVRGYLAAWPRLPGSVRRIVVIRDSPRVRDDTDVCVERAMARRRPAGRACAVPRRFALVNDPEAIAAARLRSPRVRTVDLTRFFCDARRCYPVVGGALVHKDRSHLTTVFARTLGPYLDRALNPLLGSARGR